MSEWDQVSLRRLENGDYQRISVARYGTEARIELGNVSPDGDHFEWRWAMELSIAGLALLHYEIAQAIVVLGGNAKAQLQQQGDQVTQLREMLRVEPGAAEVVDLEEVK